MLYCIIKAHTAAIGNIAKPEFKLALKLLSNLDFIKVWELFTVLFTLFGIKEQHSPGIFFLIT